MKQERPRIDAEEAIWRRIIEAAKEHYADRLTEEDQRLVHERSPLFVNDFFIPIRRMLGILRVHREPPT